VPWPARSEGQRSASCSTADLSRERARLFGQWTRASAVRWWDRRSVLGREGAGAEGRAWWRGGRRERDNVAGEEKLESDPCSLLTASPATAKRDAIKPSQGPRFKAPSESLAKAWTKKQGWPFRESRFCGSISAACLPCAMVVVVGC
jgi:hypothetical protein